MALALVSVVWLLLYAPGQRGLVNAWLSGLSFGAWEAGNNQSLLSNPWTALPAIMLLSIWQGLGFQTVILLAGLQGSGKTTTAAKLAKRLTREGRQPLLAALDVYRPAAIDQLETLGRQVKVPVFADREEKNVAKLAKRALEQATRDRHRAVILDTAGRLQIDADLVRGQAHALGRALAGEHVVHRLGEVLEVPLRAQPVTPSGTCHVVPPTGTSSGRAEVIRVWVSSGRAVARALARSGSSSENTSSSNNTGGSPTANATARWAASFTAKAMVLCSPCDP